MSFGSQLKVWAMALNWNSSDGSQLKVWASALYLRLGFKTWGHIGCKMYWQIFRCTTSMITYIILLLINKYKPTLTWTLLCTPRLSCDTVVWDRMHTCCKLVNHIPLTTGTWHHCTYILPIFHLTPISKLFNYTKAVFR